jgi:hypothetical protein
MKPIKRKCELEGCGSRSRHCKIATFGDAANRRKLLLCPECLLVLKRIYRNEKTIREFSNSEPVGRGNSSAPPTD